MRQDHRFVNCGSSAARCQGDEDRAAADPSVVEIVQRVQRGLEGVLLRVERDLAGLGEDHQLGQVGVGADDVADHVLLLRDEVQRRGLELAAVADDGHVAVGRGHRPGVLLGALLGHEVEDDLGALALGELLDRLDVVAVRQHGLVGADLLGERQRVRVAVDDDDLGGGEGGEALDADVAQPSRALHDRGRARVQQRHRLADRVVGRDTGVGERRDVLRLRLGLELHAGPCAGAQVLRHAAVVAGQAGEVVVGALHVLAAPTRRAQPARGERVQDHGVADLDVRDPVADLVDPAGVLVADDVGQLRVHRGRPVAVDDVQVGAAHAGATDLDDHVQRTLELRLRDVVDLRVFVVGVHADGLHSGLLSYGGGLRPTLREPGP